MSLWELYTQFFVRNWRCRRFAWSLSQGCSEDQKDVVMTTGRWSSWSIRIPQFLMFWWPAMKAGSTTMTQRPRDSSQWKHAGSPRPKKARQSKSTHKLLMIPSSPPSFFFFFFFFFFLQHWHDLHALGSHWTVNKEYYVEVLREFRKRFCWKRPTLFKSGLWHFHQDNTPVHNSILVTDYLIKMGMQTVPHPSYCPDLALCDFWLFPKLKEKIRCCCYETMKETVMKVIDTLTQEDFHGAFQRLLNGTSALQLEEITLKRTRVSCVYYQ